jgi:hypothetical protein
MYVIQKSVYLVTLILTLWFKLWSVLISIYVISSGRTYGIPLQLYTVLSQFCAK